MDLETCPEAGRYRVLKELILRFSLGSCGRALIQFAFKNPALAAGWRTDDKERVWG